MRSSTYQQSKHLETSEVYPATARCPVCLADGPRKPVFLLQDSPAIHLLQCPKCRVASADQMPLPAVLDAYYTSYWPDETDKLTFRSGDYLASRILKYVSIDRNRDPIRILDFGGGEGTLARLIAQGLMQARTVNFEIDVVDWGAADQQVGDNVAIRGHRTLETVKGPYDLVIASAVLEHVPDANAVMRTLFSLVGPGGYFYARTPYVLPLARLHRNLDFTYPGHVHDMGSAFWGRITETFGLRAKVIHSGPSPVETLLTKHPTRTILAWTLKVPALIEGWIVPSSRRDRFWNLVGGWEIVLRFAE
jgi:SAM-dependent methyltransferase